MQQLRVKPNRVAAPTITQPRVNRTEARFRSIHTDKIERERTRRIIDPRKTHQTHQAVAPTQKPVPCSPSIVQKNGPHGVRGSFGDASTNSEGDTNDQPNPVGGQMYQRTASEGRRRGPSKRNENGETKKDCIRRQAIPRLSSRGGVGNDRDGRSI